MSLFVPPASFTAYESNLTSVASTIGTSVAASATPHTKNTTYTQLIASTAFDASLILLRLTEVASTGADSSLLVDIAIGGAAAEEVVIPNLNAGGAGGFANTFGAGCTYLFPLSIPAGSRLSATAQATIVSDTVRVAVWLFGRPKTPVWAGSQVVAYGADLATSKGVSVAAGLSGAEGSWTQITSATSQDHYYLAAGVGPAATIAAVTGSNFLDVGVGGAAAEEAIMENLWFWGTSTEAVGNAFPLSVYSEVASGTRLAARMSTHGAGAMSYDCILYGLS